MSLPLSSWGRLGVGVGGIQIHIPCFSAYFNLFSLTISKYPFPYLPSLNTVTITTGGLPDGLWYAGGACRLLPPRWNSHINVKKARQARAMGFRFFSRRLRIIGMALVLGRKGGGFDDFRGGYAKCIAGSERGGGKSNGDRRRSPGPETNWYQMRVAARCGLGFVPSCSLLLRQKYSTLEEAGGKNRRFGGRWKEPTQSGWKLPY